MSDAPAANSRLDRLTVDLEKHVAEAGWDQPPRLFALVETVDLLRREPHLATELGLDGSTPGDGPTRSSRRTSSSRSRSCCTRS